MEEGRDRLRRTALRLRAAGLALIAISSGAAAVGAALPARANPWFSFGSLIAAAVAPAATPSPAPSPERADAPQAARGGPITFSLTGSLSLGERGQTQVTPDLAGGQVVTSNVSALDNAGLMAQIERRTATTSLQIGVPAGVTLRRSNLGQVQAGYYTPKFGLIYGGQPLALLGGVPLGQTLLGFAGVVPLHGGDLTFFTGPAYGPSAATYDVAGFRGRMLLRETLLEFGADRARAHDGSTVSALLLGAARNSGFLSQSLEAAFERGKGGADAPSRGYSYQYQAAYGSGALYGTLTARRITDGFISFGSGALQADDFVSGSVRAATGNSTLDVDESFESAGSGDTAMSSRRGAFTFTHQFPQAGVETMLSFSDQRRRSTLGVDWTGGVSLQTGFTMWGSSAALGAQLQRATLDYGNPIGLMTYTAEIQRQFGSLNGTAAYQSVRQTGDAPGLQGLGMLAITRTFGSTALTFGFDREHVINSLENVVQSSPTVTLAQRVSAVASVALTYGEQRTQDLTNPSAGGRNRIFSIQLAAPFALGNGAVQGRVNPRLPATIAGMVLNDSGTNQYGFASAVGNGVGNVVVVLDDKDVQRTDLSGRYQFNFVAPGPHEVRLESSSLPRGVTVDQPYASVVVLGGQQAEVTFRIGTYGAIAGHVTGRDGNGASMPLENVALQLDGAAYARTDAFGAYSFGRLAAGTHSIAVQESSLPASVYFAKSIETQKVIVRNGEVTTLDFDASPLGSVAGMVTFDKSLAPGYRGGVDNAYVVAEPGDYAAITNADGSFLLDDLPAGTYSLDLDPETVPDGTGNISGPISVSLGGDEHKEGVAFTVGKKIKAVVFSFKTTQLAEATMSVSEPALPPLGSAQVDVVAGEPARSVVVDVSGTHFPLAYDPRRARWSGTIVVPRSAPPGVLTISADVRAATKDGNTSASAALTVDPSLALASFKMTPAKPVTGQYVTVHARFLLPVQPGDSIRWLDGQVTKLERPVVGRIYVFTVKISEPRMRGILLTRQGQLPIILR